MDPVHFLKLPQKEFCIHNCTAPFLPSLTSIPQMVFICLYVNVILGYKQTLHISFCSSPDAHSKIFPASLQSPCKQLPGTTPYTWTEPSLLSVLGRHSDIVTPQKPPYPWYTQGEYCPLSLKHTRAGLLPLKLYLFLHGLMSRRKT